MPTPMPALPGAPTKACTAWVNASQRVGCMMGLGGFSQFESAAGQLIDPDLSSMMKMSLGTWLESDVCSAHPSPTLPVPELVPVPTSVPVCEPPVLVLFVPVWVPPDCEPPVSVPDPPVSPPVPVSNVELLPLLPQALAITKPTDSMQ